ncbi:hypothetical protein [Myroides odoratus]|uniref:hypothetical protein n=1 Tax=Myroides odoratus TaxID=256 RepID=UPI0033427B2C
MRFFNGTVFCFLVLFFTNCSSADEQSELEKEDVLVVSRMMYTYEVTSIADGEHQVFYKEPTRYISYDSKGRIAFIDKIERLGMSQEPKDKSYTKTAYVYDDTGKLVTLTCIDAKSMEVLNKLNLKYNSLGWMVQSVDEIERVVTDYGYNMKNEIISIKSKGNNQTIDLNLTYNDTGNLIGVYDRADLNKMNNIDSSTEESFYSNKNLDFLNSHFSSIPWVNTEMEQGFLECDGKIWEVTNTFSKENPFYSNHELTYKDNNVTLRYYYSFVYKRLRIKK